MFDLRRNESESVRSGCERKHKSQVVEPRAAYLSSILNCYDSKAQTKLPSSHSLVPLRFHNSIPQKLSCAH